MVTVTGSDGLTYDYEDKVLTITGTGTINAISSGVIDTNVLSCTDMEFVKIGEGITAIGDNSAFTNCRKLKAASLPSTLTTIGNLAFTLCYGLERIDIPASVTTIKQWGFYECPKLKTVIFHSLTAPTFGYQILFGTTVDTTIISPGWATQYTMPAASVTGSRTVKFLSGTLADDYQVVYMNGNKVQVESAVRDGVGNPIDKTYQEKLISGTTLKTINSNSLLGSGDIIIPGLSTTGDNLGLMANRLTMIPNDSISGGNYVSWINDDGTIKSANNFPALIALGLTFQGQTVSNITYNYQSGTTIVDANGKTVSIDALTMILTIGGNTYSFNKMRISITD